MYINSDNLPLLFNQYPSDSLTISTLANKLATWVYLKDDTTSVLTLDAILGNI